MLTEGCAHVTAQEKGGPIARPLDGARFGRLHLLLLLRLVLVATDESVVLGNFGRVAAGEVGWAFGFGLGSVQAS